jgi:hypothetical protein
VEPDVSVGGDGGADVQDADASSTATAAAAAAGLLLGLLLEGLTEDAL